VSKIAIALFGILALTLAACGGDAPATTVEPLELVIEAYDMGFTPNVIEITAGQPVRLTLNNVGFLEHDWSVKHMPVTNVREHSAQSAGHAAHMDNDDPDLHVAAMMGEQGVVEFTPTEPGEYEIVCTVAGHEAAGMVGRLIVKAP
jgi:uncharacterized cupredoxin-like copper-binding protein